MSTNLTFHSDLQVVGLIHPLEVRQRGTTSNILYLVIKDHPFSDGNKRIGSFLFMLYLEQEGIAHTLNPAALTALALLIAESAPTSKDLLIRLVMNLLGERPV